MKFALQFAGHSPEEGGGHTFETEIITAWLKAHNRHEVYFCSHHRTLPKALEHLGSRYISTCPGGFERCLWKFEKERRRLFRGLGWRSLPPFPSVSSLIAAGRLRREGIRLVWHLSQWATPVLEMPYAMTIWDLQHRLQPYFPEVSAEGNWDIREKHFRSAIQRASIIITGTRRGKREIEHFYGVDADRVHVIPLPTPSFAIAKENDSDRASLHSLKLPNRFFFYPAQFWSHKNHIVLLRALQLLRNRHEEAPAIVFVGSDHGNLAHVKATAAKLGVSDLVFFLGYVSHAQLKALYRQASALTFPSYFGPDNLPPLEAFALGCPVIAADVPGAEEQLGDAALRVPASSEEAFADAASRILQDASLRQALIDKGKARAKQFTAADYVNQMSAILDEFEYITRCWP